MQTKTRTQKNPAAGESGAVVIVAAVMILVIVTILGLTAINTSTVEVTIAANDQFAKLAFYNADSGLNATAKLISEIRNAPQGPIPAGSTGDAPGLEYLSPDPSTPLSNPEQHFYQQVMFFGPYESHEDLDFQVGGIDARTEVRYIDTVPLAGSGTKFGDQVLGTGHSHDVTYFNINATGTSARNTSKVLNATYRKMGVGLQGGL